MPDLTDKEKKLWNRWRDRVKVAKNYHETHFLPRIEEIEEMDRGKQWMRDRTSHDGMDQITVNLVWANKRAIVPQLFFQRPEVTLEPLTDRLEDIDPSTGEPRLHDVVRSADVAKPVIEQKLDQIGWKSQMQRCVRDGYLFGYGVAKHGWGSQYGKVGEKALDKDDAENAAQRTPVTGCSSDVHANQPWCLRVHPRDIFLPPWARSYDELEYIVMRVYRRTEDVKSDSRYKNTENLQGTRDVMDRYRSKNDVDASRNEDFVELHEVCYRTSAQKDDPMDKGYRPGTTLFKRITLAEGHEGPLSHEIDEDAMLFGGYPYEFLVYSEDSDRVYPMSDIMQAIGQQKEINKLRSHNLEMVKRQNPPILYGQAAFADPEQEQQFLSGAPMRAVKVNSVQDFSVPQMPAITADNYRLQERMMQDFRIVTGVGANQQGAADADSATEASIIQSSLNVRTNDMLDKTREFAVKCIEKIFILISERTEEEEIVRIEGNKGVEWRKWTGRDVRGPYRFKIDLTSMQPPNSNVRKKMAFDFLNLASTMPQYFNMPELITQVARTYEDVFPNVDAILKESEEPRQQDELLDMLNGAEVQIAPDQNHGEHLQVLTMFMQSPFFQILSQTVPEAAQLVANHAAMHQQMMQQMNAPGVKKGAGNSPSQGAGAIPAMMATNTPTEGSIMAGANGGRPLQGGVE